MKLWLAALVLSASFAYSQSQAQTEADRPANELGKIMILEYHQLGTKEGDWKRSFENFRADLERLYAEGYRLVNLNDVLDGQIDVPAGTTPVVLTFDDGARGQFKQDENGWVADSAVGIILEFASRHPDMGVAGTFYINNIPSKELTTPRGTNILQDMIDAGFELGNHTRSHPKLNKLSQSEVAAELAAIEKLVQANVPGYIMRSVALPFGIYPKKDAWAAEGESKGLRYSYDALLEVGAGPTASPFSTKFKRLHLPRIQAFDSELNKHFSYFDKNPGQRYVGDGNENVITVPAGKADTLLPEFEEFLKEI